MRARGVVCVSSSSIDLRAESDTQSRANVRAIVPPQLTDYSSSAAPYTHARANDRARAMSRIDVYLESHDSKYADGDTIRGEVVVCVEREDAPFEHTGVVLNAIGTAQLRVSDKSVTIIESLFISVDPVTILDVNLVLAPPGRLGIGMHTFTFSFALRGTRGQEMYETFHGQNTQIVYAIDAEIIRPILRGGSLSTGMCEFLVETKPDEDDCEACACASAVAFEITEEQQDLGPAPGALATEGFLIRGVLDRTSWFLEEAITGTITVERSAAPLKAIEIELCRIEGCSTTEGQVMTETSPVQFTQVVDGDCARGSEIPIHVVIPRLFTCPSVQASSFSVAFMLRVLCIFEPLTPGNKEPVAVRAIPIQLYRGGNQCVEEDTALRH